MTPFQEATAVEQVDAHTYSAYFVDDWRIGTVPHGGYVTSCLLQAVRKHFDTTLRGQNQPHTVALHVDFLRRTGSGPATFRIKTVKLGRQASVVHVTLVQDDREEAFASVTNANIEAEQGVSFDTKWELSPPPAPVDIAALEAGRDPAWIERLTWPFEDFRKAHHHVRPIVPRAGQPCPAVYDQWYCFRDPTQRFTNESLGYVVDIFPQVIESFLYNGLDVYSAEFERKYSSDEQAKIISSSKAPAMWYPTLVLNLEVKKAFPKEGVKWLFSRLRAKSIKNGRFDLEIVILDTQGEVVALSHHVCFALGAGRNTATRRKADVKL